jgi:transposase
MVTRVLAELGPVPRSRLYPRAGDETAKTRKGNKWLRMAMIEAGQAAARTTDTALSAPHRRIMRHRGYQRAVVAVGHEILAIAHTLIARGTTYQELGPAYFDRRRLSAHSSLC